MNEEVLKNFGNYLKTFTKKNGRGLGERTVKGILTLAKFLDTAPQDSTLDSLKQLYAPYLQQHNYPIASYTLWLYLKSLGFDERFVKDVVGFKRRNHSVFSDEEKLANSVLSKKELFYLVEKVTNVRDNLLIRFMYDTAARVSEATSVKLKDIDFDTGEVQVLGKGKKPRTVYFQKDTSEILKDHIRGEKITNPNDLVFQIKPMSVWYNLRKYGKEYLSRDLHPHMLRHSRLQHMADEGVDSFAIKSYAGHSDIGTTQIYVKNSKFQRKIAFYKAGNIWEGKQ